MSLKIHIDFISQPCRAALALLMIGKLKYETINVELLKKEHKTSEYLAINPFGTVPALEHGDFRLGESNAILTYLCDAFPRQLEKYGGLTIQEKGLVSQFLSWYQGSYRPGLIKPMGLKIQIGMFQGKPVKAADLKEAEAKVKTTLDFLDKHLSSGKKYICGNNLTIADLLIFFETTNVEAYELDLAPWVKVNEWYNRMLENQSVATIHKKFRQAVPGFIQALKQVAVE